MTVKKTTDRDGKSSGPSFGKHPRLERSPWTFMITAAITGVLTVVIALVEIEHGQRLINDLYRQRGEALIQEIEQGAALTVRASDQTEHEAGRRLLSVARLIAGIEREQQLEQELLDRLLEELGLSGICILDRQADHLMTSPREHAGSEEWSDHATLLEDLPLIAGAEKIIGMHMPRGGSKLLYSAGYRCNDGRIILISLDASSLIELNRSFGLGRYIQNLQFVRGIHSAVLQDMEGIRASTPGIGEMETIASDPFLLAAWENKGLSTRLIERNGELLYETVELIYLRENMPSLLRLSFNGEEIREMEQHARQRSIIGFVFFFILMTGGVNMASIYDQLRLTRRSHAEISGMAEAILDGMGDAVIVVNRDGQVRRMNHRAEQLCGSGSELPKEIRDIISRGFSSSIVAGEEIELRTPDHRLLTLAISTSRIQYDTTESWLVLICQDISERKQIRVQMANNERVIAMGGLAAAVAHEIRNPLNAIGMAVQRLDSLINSGDVMKQQKLQRIIEEEISRLDGIIGQFLGFARAPIIELRRENLSGLIREVHAELSALADSKGVTIRVHQPDELGISLDRKQFRQVLLNLITNAIDACTAGGTIETDVSPTDTEVTIAIRDDGHGIDQADLSRVFDLYFSTKEKGTGLGLPIALMVTQSHGGSLTIESQSGSGTTALIVLPRKQEP